MLTEVLSACLFMGLAQGLNPLYHHPVYNMPVYASHHVPMVYAHSVNQQPAVAKKTAVTTYASGGGKAGPGNAFWYDMCHVPHRKIVALWNAFDLDVNGFISFTEVNKASLCDLDDADNADTNCKWMEHMEPEISHRAEFDGHSDAIMEAMIGEVMSLFHKCDANNDNIMNMDEFFVFAQHMYDACAFFVRSTRIHLDENGDPDDTGFDVIEQKEWDCAQNENGDGLDYPNCVSNAADGQMLIGDMVGNADGDDELSLWEFFAVMKNLYAKAQSSVYFDAYCTGYNPADFMDFEEEAPWEEAPPAPPAPSPAAGPPVPAVGLRG